MDRLPKKISFQKGHSAMFVDQVEILVGQTRKVVAHAKL